MTQKCSKCNKEISGKVAEYSQTKFKKPLCFDCQKTAKAIPEVKSVPKTLSQAQKPVDRETSIIRQSCLKAAIEAYPLLVRVHDRTGDVNEILLLAEKFEAWVKRKE